MNIFTKFHKDWSTIVDFLLIAKFLASAIIFASPSISHVVWTNESLPTGGKAFRDTLMEKVVK